MASYPRSGSTWLRFVLYELLTGASADFASVNRSIPRLRYANIAEAMFPGGGRLLQTHEKYRHEYARAVYLIRDVRDVVASEFWFQLAQGFIHSDLGSFIEAFLDGRVNAYGPWSRNVESWLDAEESGNAEVLLVRFELLRESPIEQIQRILQFLEVELPHCSIDSALRNNSLSRMREKESEARKSVFSHWKPNTHFVRTGSSTAGRQKLSDPQIRLIEERCYSAMQRAGYLLSQPPR